MHELGSGFSRRSLIAGACRRNAADGVPAHYEVVDPYPTVAPPGTPGVSVFRREPAESAAAGVVRGAGGGDVLFVDTTHTVKLGSDVNRIVLDVLPSLAPGVSCTSTTCSCPTSTRAAGPRTTACYWSEQYLLQAFLSGNPTGRCWCPLHAFAREQQARLRRRYPGAPAGLGPGAFWIRRRPA